MTLISVQGWDNLLSVNIDENDQMWFGPTEIEKPNVLLHTYTLDELLKEWKPCRRIH